MIKKILIAKCKLDNLAVFNLTIDPETLIDVKNLSIIKF